MSHALGRSRFGARLLPRAIWLLCALLVLLSGCHAGEKRRRVDREIIRHSEDGREAFAIGRDREAVIYYRRAVKRAWAVDDPDEVSRNAYNLAAVLASTGHYTLAHGWLAEARAELARLGQDEADVWLLQAKIARQMGHVELAVAIGAAVDAGAHRRRGKGPVVQGDPLCVLNVSPPCAGCESLDLKRPRWKQWCNNDKDGKHDHHGKRHDRVDRQVTVVHAALLEANLALDRGELESAQSALSRAIDESKKAPHPATRAEVERTSGRVALASYNPQVAGERFDLEAELFRRAEHFREVPMAFFDAAESYEMAGATPHAADRYLRAARMMYARDAYADALLVLEHALPLVEMVGDDDLVGRLGVLFREIASAIEETTPATAEESSSPSPTAAPMSLPNDLPLPAEPGEVVSPPDGTSSPIDSEPAPPDGPVVRPVPSSEEEHLLPPSVSDVLEDDGPALRSPRGARRFPRSAPLELGTTQPDSLRRSVESLARRIGASETAPR